MIHFSKWQGLGNDFVIVEPNKNPGINFHARAVELCDRHFGIGADGVVTVRPLGGTDFEMRIYNADGSEAEMCGNVSRCVGLYIQSRKLAEGLKYTLHTKAGLIGLTLLGDQLVTVDMGTPRLTRGEIPVAGTPGDRAINLPLENNTPDLTGLIGTAVSMGNPHVVIHVEDMNKVPLSTWGPQIETSPLFPAKTNVEFVQVLAPNEVRMRVWERGCGITMACGTGACATCVAGVLTNKSERMITVHLDGGDLRIEYAADNDHVYMTGMAKEVFTGIWND